MPVAIDADVLQNPFVVQLDDGGSIHAGGLQSSAQCGILRFEKRQAIRDAIARG
jgi:hypothetical protein